MMSIAWFTSSSKEIKDSNGETANDEYENMRSQFESKNRARIFKVPVARAMSVDDAESEFYLLVASKVLALQRDHCQRRAPCAPRDTKDSSA
jgi:hypothetical protein